MPSQDPPEFKLELHCDIVVIWPAILSAVDPRLNRAATALTANNTEPISPPPSMEL